MLYNFKQQSKIITNSFFWLKRSCIVLVMSGLLSNVYATSSETFHAQQLGYDPIIYLWLVIFIFLSRSLSFVKKLGLPLAVGEIIAGVILGQLHYLGIDIFSTIQHNTVIKFIAELGAIILMFEIGLESKFSDLKKNFKLGINLAIFGSILTFTGGYLISWLLISNSTIQLNLLMGIICAATATGISAKTFKEMNILRTKEVKIVLVSSILDELISIICFGIISVMLLEHSFNLTNLSLSIIQVIGFFVFAAIFGQWLTPLITNWSTKIHAGINMKLGVLLTICFLFSWVAHKMGLAFVVGSFIAGLILDQIYFKAFSQSNFFVQLRRISTQIDDIEIRNKLSHVILTQENRTLEELLKPISHLFVPIFFIYIGMMLDIKTLFQPHTLLITIALLGISFLGRILSGFVLRRENVNPLILGLGMTPIGEAGLIFAVFGKIVGVLHQNILAAIVSTIVIASIITPILIKFSIKRYGVHHE